MLIEIRNILTGNLTIAGNFVEGETPGGVINGVNTTFTLFNTPLSNSETLYLNGVRLKKSFDYTISTNIITMTLAPISGDILLIDYRY